MKIYATDTSLPATPFDQYLGKDIFVKCIMFGDEVVYARFHEKDKVTLKNGKRVPIFRISYFREQYISEYTNNPNLAYLYDLGNLVSININNIVPVTPLEVISIQDLYGELSVREILSQLAGSEVWIKIHAMSDSYIRILDITNNVVTFNWINMEQLNGLEEHEALEPFELTALDDVFTATRRRFIDGILLYEPLDILTTEEIQELIDNCPRVQHRDEGDEE